MTENSPAVQYHPLVRESHVNHDSNVSTIAESKGMFTVWNSNRPLTPFHFFLPINTNAMDDDRIVSRVPHTINSIRCLPIWSMPNGWSSDKRNIVAMAITPNSLTNRFILYYFWWCKVTSFPAYNYQHVFTFYPKMVAIYPSPWYLSQKNRRLSPAIARFPEHLYLCTRIAKQIRI